MLPSLSRPLRPSSMLPTAMRAVVASILAASVLVPFTSSVLATSSSTSSSLLSITRDLAPSLLPITLVMLVAAGTGVAAAAAAAANYSAKPMFPWLSRGGGGASAGGASNDTYADTYARLDMLNGPSLRHLNAKMLLGRLGADFDAAWMSVERPSQAAVHSPGLGPGTANAALVDELRKMGFSYTDEHGDRRTMPTAVRSIVERWMLERASCQVHYTWVDMGVFIWPRWIKHGRCDTDTPCSWPSGMHCVAAESDTLRLLHWQCRRPDSNHRVRRAVAVKGGRQRGNTTLRPAGGGDPKPKRNNGQLQCKWKKVPYPVTSECFCDC